MVNLCLADNKDARTRHKKKKTKRKKKRKSVLLLDVPDESIKLRSRWGQDGILEK